MTFFKKTLFSLFLISWIGGTIPGNLWCQESHENSKFLNRINTSGIHQCLGVYMGNLRIGEDRLDIDPVKPENPLYSQGVRYQFRELLSLHGIISDTSGTLKGDFSLVQIAFEFKGKQRASQVALSCQARIEDSTLEIEVQSVGVLSKKQIALSGLCYPPTVIDFPLLSQGLVPGSRFTGLAFDPMTQSLASFSTEVEGRETMDALGQTFEVAKINTTFQGLLQTRWVTDTGLCIRAEAINGMIVSIIESDRDSPEQEKSEGNPEDLMLQMMDRFKVEVDGEIKDARNCNLLVLEISGIAPDQVIIDEYWQHLLSGQSDAKNSFQIEIGLNSSHPQKNDDLKTYLNSTFLIQCDSPAIISQAAKITQKTSTDRIKAKQICAWVYKNLDRSSLRLTIPSAVEVLQSKRGDCNEQAALFAALARATGIPTKVCAGILYHRGEYFYHAWNEIYLESTGWTPVDTTLNQIPADATHLKMAEGELDEQLVILNVIGKIRVKIIRSDENLQTQ